MSRGLDDRIKRILILDDDITFSESIEAFLKEKQIICLCANTPKLALQMIESEWIDAVSTDYDMPGMTGEEFAEVLKEKNPDIPIIMLTGALESDHKKKMESKLFKVLTKPIKLNQVFLPICEKAIDIGYSKRKKRSIHSLIDQLNLANAGYLCFKPNLESKNKAYFERLVNRIEQNKIFEHDFC